MLWRIVTGTSILYLVILVFLLFQTSNDARILFTYDSAPPFLYCRAASVLIRGDDLRHIDPCRNGLATCGGAAVIGAAAGEPKVRLMSESAHPGRAHMLLLSLRLNPRPERYYFANDYMNEVEIIKLMCLCSLRMCQESITLMKFK